MRATIHFDGCTKPTNPGPSAGAAVLKIMEDVKSKDGYVKFSHPPTAVTYEYGPKASNVVTGHQKPITVLGEVFHGTNNEAEYQGLLVGLHEALKRGVKHLKIYGDSKLVVYQIGGHWRVKKDHLKPLCGEALALLAEFDSWTAEWVPRHLNKEADRASNEAIDNPRRIPT